MKTRSTVITGGLLLLSFIIATAQRETLDMISFVPPEGWVRGQGAHAVTYYKYNTAQTIYCLIAIYDSRPGTANAEQELVADWNSLLRKTYNIEAPAEAKKYPKGNDWMIIHGEKQIKTDNIEFRTVLFTVVGHGRVASIVLYIPNESFMNEVETFLTNLEFIVPQPVTTTESSQVKTNTQDTKTTTEKKIPTGKKACNYCILGYNQCTSCFGRGRKSETVYVSEYDPVSKGYVSRPETRSTMCMACSGVGKTMCTYCHGMGFVE